MRGGGDDDQVVPSAVTRTEIVAGVPLSLVAGVVVGTIGTFKHQYGISAVTGNGLPIGLVLSLAMVLALLVALRLAFPTRWYAFGAAVGIVVADLALLLPGASGGSTVILDNAPGMVWVVGPAALGVGAVVWPRRRRRVVPDAGGILESAGTSDPTATKDD